MAIVRKILLCVLLLTIVSNGSYVSANNVRLKDIARIQGIRDNQLIGYGLVVGLNGTGDTSATSFTFQSVVSMLQKLGVNVNKDSMTVKNVAAVIVTLDLPPFIKEGTRLDCVVSSLGNASSLQGGTLLMTPLQGPDEKVYAVAQGPISVGGFSAGSEAGAAGGMNVQKNFSTVGRIPQGVLIEREVPMEFVNDNKMSIILSRADFTTCDRVVNSINLLLGNADSAFARDASTIDVTIPEEFQNNVIGLIAKLETIEVNPDNVAIVVINERTGTIVAGKNVKISTVAVAHGNLSIEVKSRYKISQPEPFSKTGTTVSVPEEETTVQEENAKLMVINEGVDIAQVASALNVLGVTPRDMIAIFQAMKEAGAFQAELRII